MNGAMPTPEISEDAILGGAVRVRQPRDGFRVAIDAVLLAAAVPASAGDIVLDVGCGVGAASLCLATRVPACRVVAFDRQRDLVRLASDNIVLNNLGTRITAMAGDLLRPPPRLEPGAFAHVMANPPFLEAGKASPSPDRGKAEASIEGEADLAAWVRFALAMTSGRGTITFIHRADRLQALLSELSGRGGVVVVFPF